MPLHSQIRSPIRALALLSLLLVATACDRGSSPQQIGKPAPQFTLSDGGQTLDLATLRGHVVVLNFWASWCGPCVEELPSLNALAHAAPEVSLIGISFDYDPAAYARFLTRHEVDFRTLNDPAQRINALYGTYRPPETYILDKQGTIRRKLIGPQDWTNPELLDYLRKLAAA